MREVESIEKNPPRGPCKRIMERRGGLIRQMVSQTEETGKEHAVIIVEANQNMASTNIVPGDEESILSKTMAELRMDSIEVSDEVTRPGENNIRDYKSHSIHSHPGGHPEPSLRDIETIIKNLSLEHPGNSATSNLIATQMENGIVLSGLYRKKPSSKSQMRKPKAVLESLSSGMMDIGRTGKKGRLIEELKSVGYMACSVTFPER